MTSTKWASAEGDTSLAAIVDIQWAGNNVDKQSEAMVLTNGWSTALHDCFEELDGWLLGRKIILLLQHFDGVIKDFYQLDLHIPEAQSWPSADNTFPAIRDAVIAGITRGLKAILYADCDFELSFDVSPQTMILMNV